MKSCKYLLILFVAILCGCKDDSVEFGEGIYYPDFLWSKSKQICAEKTFDFEFSQDAKNDANTFAEFAFVDSHGDMININCFHIYVNDQKQAENKFKINCNTDSVNIRFEFSPQAKDGKYQGYLKLINHNLDRIDSQDLTSSSIVDVLQWTLVYKKRMNPVAKSLLCGLCVILSLLLLWFIVLRPIFYPHFGSFGKNIIVMQNGRTVFMTNEKFNRARKVIFATEREKQSLFSKIFQGSVKTVVNDNFSPKITFLPNGKCSVALGQDWTISPNPFPANGVVKIQKRSGDITINLK